MQQRELRMELKRKPAVRSRKETPPRHPYHFGYKELLSLSISDVLYDRIRVADIEALVTEREPPAVVRDELDQRVSNLQVPQSSIDSAVRLPGFGYSFKKKLAAS